MASNTQTADKAGAPGTRWRFLAHGAQGTTQLENAGVFDELVVDDWLHVEQLDERVWWLRVGDARIMVTLIDDGTATVDVERGSYGPTRGNTVSSGDDGSSETK